MALTPQQKKCLSKQIDEENKAYINTMEKTRIDEKNKHRIIVRAQHMARREQENLNRMQEEKEEAAKQARLLQHETDLAREMSELKRKEINEIKLRQQIRENSEELRDLERKLRCCYDVKENWAMIAEKESRKVEQKLREKREQEEFQKAVVEESEYKKQIQIAEIIKKNQYRKELQDQMILNDYQRRAKYEEFLVEKKLIDDIIQRIHEEDEREILEKMCKMKKTREEMDKFKQAQEVWKNKMKETLAEEDRKIQEYLLAKATKAFDEEEEKLKIRKEKEEKLEKVIKQMCLEQAKKRERDDIIQELLLEEQTEAIEARHKEELEKTIRNSIEIKKCLEKQMMEKKMRVMEEEKRDAKYKEELMKKLVEDERVEMLSNEKKRLKMVQIRKDVEGIINERRRKHAEELEKNRRLFELGQLEERRRRDIIEEERQKMLREHCKNLVGFIPKSLLRSMKPDVLESKSN